MDGSTATLVYAAEDLGKPIPESGHAVSVCLPLWADNVGYEEWNPRVIDRLQCGYPRFYIHPLAVELFGACEERFAARDECCFAFPSRRVAQRCVEFIQSRSGAACAVHDFGAHGVHAVTLPHAVRETAKSFWEHTGEIVTSRLAAAALQKETFHDDGTRCKNGLQETIARWAGSRPEDVFLFPTGMAAIFAAYRAFQRLQPGLRSVQFGFAYVDTLKIQQRFSKTLGSTAAARATTNGSGSTDSVLSIDSRTARLAVQFYPAGTDAELARLKGLLQTERIMGLFCEFPANPLLSSPSLPAIDELARTHGFPVLVDETIGTFVNVDVLPRADVVATSLTKFFSGRGDVMGGSLVLNRDRPLYREIKAALEEEYEDLLCPGDARVLLENAEGFGERVERINRSAEQLCDAIRNHPAVARIDYPKYRTTENYRACLKPGGGFGGLFSILLHEPEINAPALFDDLKVSKGPNLGTNYTMCCPYTILAHYRELDFAERCGVSQYLLRVSVGLEEPQWIIEQFIESLDRIATPAQS